MDLRSSDIRVRREHGVLVVSIPGHNPVGMVVEDFTCHHCLRELEFDRGVISDIMSWAFNEGYEACLKDVNNEH